MATKKTRFYILDNGYMEMDQNWIVQNFFTWANANEKEKKAVWLRVPVYCVLIDHPDRGWILYDCGVDPRAMIDAWPAPNQLFFPYTHTEEQLLVNQLAKVGLKPEDITTVVVSHGHVDHVGNLPLFTHADVYWGKEDFDYCMEALHSMPGIAVNSIIRADVDVQCKSLTYITEDTEIASGVTLLPCPGHTPCVLALLLELENESYLFTNDVADTALNFGPPAIPSEPCNDTKSLTESVERLRKIAKAKNAKVMFPHEMEQFNSCKKAPDFYE